MSLIKDIRENWLIIFFISSLIVTWTTFGLRLTTVEVKAQKSEDVLTTRNLTLENLSANVFIICHSISIDCIPIK